MADRSVGDTGTLLDDYLTDFQLGRELGVTERTVRNWRALGEAPPITRIGHRIYTARADARAWLQAQRREVA